MGGEQLSRWLVFAALGTTRLKATSNAPAPIYLAPIVPNKSDYGQPMPSCCSARQLPANGGRTATKAASNGALAAAIRPHHHQRRPLLGRQMLVVGSHRNTLPERCCTWLLSPPLYKSQLPSLLSGNFVDGAGQVTGREYEKGLFECYRLELGFGRLGLFGLGDSQCTSANLFSRN